MPINMDEVMRTMEVRDAETARRITVERYMARKRVEAQHRGIPLDELLADAEEQAEAALRRFVKDLRGGR